MRNLNLLLISIVLATSVSCQDNDMLDTQTIGSVQTKSDTMTESRTHFVDAPVKYLAEKNYEEWTRIRHVEDRIKACNPTQEEVERMSTEALVKSIVHYPLNYLIFAYDDPMTAINLLADNSVIHKEFEKRSDAAKTIIDLFSETEGVEMDPYKKTFSEYKCLQYSDATFLEYYMASERIPNIYAKETAEKLGIAINKKIEERVSQPEIYNYSSIQPLLIMGASPELTQYVMSIPVPPAIGSTTVYTPFGKTIRALINEDYTQPQIAAISLYYVLEWPEADSIAPATNMYNCHSYAWYNQSEYNDLWINKTDSMGVFQLSRYWSTDLYESCSQQYAEKVFYVNTVPDKDHSAVVLPNGYFISKWGGAPLMVHEADYCPYYFNNTELQYYKERTYIPFMSDLISGADYVSPGQSSIYYRGYIMYSDLDYSWSLSGYPMDPNLPAVMTVGQNNNYAQVTFNSAGLYVIRLEVSYNNQVFTYSEKQIYVFDD